MCAISTSGQFSRSHIAIEYGSSPDEQGTDQMRMLSAADFRRRAVLWRSVVEASELMIFADRSKSCRFLTVEGVDGSARSRHRGPCCMRAKYCAEGSYRQSPPSGRKILRST